MTAIGVDPTETELAGSWMMQAGRMVGDAIEQRIGALVAEYLVELRRAPDGWEVLYRDPAEARMLLDSIDALTPPGLPDRALIGPMVYSFARIGAALGMAIEAVFTQNVACGCGCARRSASAAMPCHDSLEDPTAYLDGAVQRDDPKGPLFRTIGRGTGKRTRTGAAAGERLCDDPPARGGSRHRERTRQR